MCCKLCKKNQKLMNSHIIPEFIYKPLYDKKHRFYVFSTYEKKDRPMEQKGIREKLLCNICEQRLSTYENYAKKVLSDEVEIKMIKEGGGVVVSGIRYKDFKLFQLSILWRASISSHKMFKNVSLGKHESIIREMIMSDTPGEPGKYCCVMTVIKNGRDEVADFIDQPEKIKIDGHTTYRFIFGSIAWGYFVSSHKIPTVINSFVLSEKGEVRMNVKDISDMNCITGFAQELKKKGGLTGGN